MNIGFIGAGKVGEALGLYAQKHGLALAGYFSKTGRSAQEAARMTKSQHFTSMQDIVNASSVLLIAVPDHAFEEVDHAIATLMKDRIVGHEKFFFHVSGAHSSEVFSDIKAAGAEVGSIHPLQSFGDPVISADRLQSCWFTIEGTEKAVKIAKNILNKTGGTYSEIKTEDKPLYHAGACIVSNFLITLLDIGIKCFLQAGMDRETLFSAMDPLIESTLSNVRKMGTKDALTGPIVRGDFNTVSLHLDAIRTSLPEELDTYQSLACRTIQMLNETSWTREQAEGFRLLLGGTIHVK